MYKLTSQYISKNTTNSKHMAHNKGPKAMTHARKVACMFTFLTINVFIIKGIFYALPEQVLPSPVYPVLHEHEYPPGLF